MTGPAWWLASRPLRRSGRTAGDGQQKLKYMFMCRMSCMVNPPLCQVSHLHNLTRSSAAPRGRGNVNLSSVRRDLDVKHMNNRATQSTQLGIFKRKKKKPVTRIIFALLNQQLFSAIFFLRSPESFVKPNKWKVCGGFAECVGVRQ